MTGGLDEIETGMDAVVYGLLPVDATLLFEISIKAGLYVFDDGFPALKMSKVGNRPQKCRTCHRC